MNRILIKNARIVNEGTIFEGDVLIEDKFITDRGEFYKLLETFESSASTNFDKGIALGYAKSEKSHDVAVKNQVIVFTDAKFELSSETKKIISTAHKKYGIELGVYYFGNYSNEELQKMVGKYGAHYATDKTQSPKEMLVNMTEGSGKDKECKCDEK